MGRVAGMACICCKLMGVPQEGKTYVHHIRQCGEERNNMLVLPLCWWCHQGPNGVHGDETFLRILKMSEWALLAFVIAELYCT